MNLALFFVFLQMTPLKESLPEPESATVIQVRWLVVKIYEIK